MTAELLYKLGSGLLSLTAIFSLFYFFPSPVFTEQTAISDPDLVPLLLLGNTVLLLFAGILNIVISRAGIRPGIFRAFTWVNILAWGLMILICLIYFSWPHLVLFGLTFLCFLGSLFVKTNGH